MFVFLRFIKILSCQYLSCDPSSYIALHSKFLALAVCSSSLNAMLNSRIFTWQIRDRPRDKNLKFRNWLSKEWSILMISYDIWWYHMISDHQWYQMTTNDCWCTIWIINLNDTWWYLVDLNLTIEYNRIHLTSLDISWHQLTYFDSTWHHCTNIVLHIYARLLLEQVGHKLPFQPVHLRSHWQILKMHRLDAHWSYLSLLV